MQFLDVIGDLAGADQRQHVDLARPQQGGHEIGAVAVNDVDHTLREGAPEGFEQRIEQQHAEAGRLEQHRVAHDEGWNESRKRLVEGIIVRTHAQHDAKRCAANLADRPLSNDEAGAVIIQLLERVDGCGNVGNGAIEFLLGIGQGLADFPHDEADDLVPLCQHLPRKVFHAGDSISDRRRRPSAAAVGIGFDGRGERRLRRLGRPLRIGADLGRLQVSTAIPCPDRRDHGLVGAMPLP